MASLSELESYKGDAGLGLGSNAGISAPNNANLNAIEQASRDIMLLNNQRNMLFYQQKIKERDDLAKLIATDQVQTGDILPEYQAGFDQRKKKAEAIFVNEFKGDFNNTSAWQKYKSAITDLKDYAAHAQSNTVGIKALQVQQANTALPTKQKEIGDWIDKQRKQDFWQPINPFQTMLDVNFNKLKDYYSTVNLGQQLSKDGKWINTGATKADWKSTLNKATSDYLSNNEQSENQRQALINFQQQGTDQLNSSLDALNAQIDKYNTQLGLKQGNADFVDHIKAYVDNTGRSIIQETPNVFAAKYALANQNQFVTAGEKKFNSAFGTYLTSQERNAIGWKNANTAAKKADVYGDYMKWKMSPTDEEEGGKQAVTLWKDLTNNIKFGGQIEDVTKVTKNGKVISENRTKKGEFDYIPATAIPESRKFIGGVTYDANSKKYVASKIEPNTFANGVKGYTVRYKFGGKVFDRNDESADITKNFKNSYQAYKQSHPNDSEQDYIKRMVDDGTLEVEFEGKGGKIGTLKSAMESARAINNALYKKGQPDVINPNESGSETDNGEE